MAVPTRGQLCLDGEISEVLFGLDWKYDLLEIKHHAKVHMTVQSFEEGPKS